MTTPIDIRTAKPKPATLAEIQTELGLIAGRLNGLISKEALLIWAHDLADEHTFAVVDYREAGRRMAERIAEGGRGAATGRPQITDIVALAKEARSKRLETAAAASDAKRLEAKTRRSPEELAANARTASWVIAQVQAGKAPTEQETRDFHAAQLAGEQRR